MGWRADVEVDQHTESVLQEQFDGPGLSLGREEDGRLYMAGPEFDDCSTPGEVHEVALRAAQRMTRTARLVEPSCQPVRYLGRVRGDGPGGVAHLFAEARMHAYSRLTVGPPVRIHQGVEDHAAQDAHYAAALDIIGGADVLGALELQKIYELLKASAGGSEAHFRRQTGWSKSQLSSFTGSLNRPDVLGAEARHAVVTGEPPRRPMTLTECRDAILGVARRWPSLALQPSSPST